MIWGFPTPRPCGLGSFYWPLGGMWRIAMGSWWGLFWTDKIPGFPHGGSPVRSVGSLGFSIGFWARPSSIGWILGGDACLHLADARALWCLLLEFLFLPQWILGKWPVRSWSGCIFNDWLVLYGEFLYMFFHSVGIFNRSQVLLTPWFFRGVGRLKPPTRLLWTIINHIITTYNYHH